MLTWAYVFLTVRILQKDDTPNGLHFVIACGCDVAIFYYIACAIVGAKP